MGDQARTINWATPQTSDLPAPLFMPTIMAWMAALQLELWRHVLIKPIKLWLNPTRYNVGRLGVPMGLRRAHEALVMICPGDRWRPNQASGPTA